VAPIGDVKRHHFFIFARGRRKRRQEPFCQLYFYAKIENRKVGSFLAFFFITVEN